jgi:hypothetical protein
VVRRFPRRGYLQRVFRVVLVPLLGFAAPTWAAQVGHIESDKGPIVMVRPGEKPGLAGKDEGIGEGYAIGSGREKVSLRFVDESRVRLESESTLAIDKYVFEAGKDEAKLRLLQGGIHVTTRGLAKRNPEGFRITSGVNEVRVRGNTELTARLCTDCKLNGAERLAAKVHSITGGNLLSYGKEGVSRILDTKIDQNIYLDDTLETKVGTTAVIVYVDGMKQTLTQETRMRIAQYDRQKNVAELELIRGALRTLTGSIAKTPQALRISTPSGASVWPAGTGFDLLCDDRCASASADVRPNDGLYLYTWEGSVDLGVGSKILRRVERGTSAFLGVRASNPILLDAVPERMLNNPAPRPDAVAVDMEALFPQEPTLQVEVHEGSAVLSGKDGDVELGPGDAAEVRPDGTVTKTKFDAPTRLTPPILTIENERSPGKSGSLPSGVCLP